MRRLALLLAALCGADLDAPMPALKITLHHGAHDRCYAPPDEDALVRVEFCAYCEDPHTEGSLARGLTALQGARQRRPRRLLVEVLLRERRNRLHR